MKAPKKILTRLKSSAVFTVLVLVGIANGSPGISVGGDTSGLYVEGVEWVSGNPFVTIANPSLGVTFGEKLLGQSNSPSGDFDVISGTPNTPLTMDTSIGANYREANRAESRKDFIHKLEFVKKK